MKRPNKDVLWYNLRHMNSYANWAVFYILIGARMRGKSYSVAEYFIKQYKKYHLPFYWLRLTEKQSKKLLSNKAEKLVDPDLRRKYNLDLVVSGENVYNVLKRSQPDKNGKTKILEKELFARVLCLSTFFNDKGSLYDKDFLALNPNHKYLIALDEFEREKGERNSFDIVYSLVNQLENIARTTKDRIKVFFLGNTLEEASDILCSFNFIPEDFGIFKLKKRRCVIENIPNSDSYLKMRKGSIADLLMGSSSSFTNKIDTDKTLINTQRLIRPVAMIKFTKSDDSWFIVWNSNIIAQYKKGQICKNVIAMRPYLDERFIPEQRNNVIELFDSRSYEFNNLITFKKFQTELKLLRTD